MTFSHSSDATTNISTSLKILSHKVVQKSPHYLYYISSTSKLKKKKQTKKKQIDLPTLPIFRPKGQTILYFSGILGLWISGATTKKKSGWSSVGETILLFSKWKLPWALDVASLKTVRRIAEKSCSNTPVPHRSYAGPTPSEIFDTDVYGIAHPYKIAWRLTRARKLCTDGLYRFWLP